MAHDVFISYSSKDKKAAEAVCAKLEAEGIICWIAPRDIPPSARYAQSIINGINASRLMIFIFSSHATDSEHIESEIDRAYNKRIPIIPLRTEDIPLSGSLEYYLSTAQWFDALPPLKEHLEKLPGLVRQLLETKAPAAAEPPQPSERSQPKSSRRSFFGSTAFKLTAGLVLFGLVATFLFLWFQPTKKTESHEANNTATQHKSDNTIAEANEIVIDSSSQLMWTKKPNGADVSWKDAVKYCSEIALGGFDDWQLPSRLDLYATNDSDIAESDRVWKSLQLQKACCYWASNQEDEDHALAYNLTNEVKKLLKTNRKEMRALCVRTTE